MAGCSSSGMVPLEGKVTLDGKPLPTGVVTFHNTQDGPSGYGQVQPDGNYAARTGTQTGLKPGDYTVTVSAHESSAASTGFVEVTPRAITPARYASAETSGLRYHVTESGGTYDIQLTTAASVAGAK